MFQEASTCLKVCGVTVEEEAERLVEMKVEALGFNFYKKSKRYLEPSEADWLKVLAGKVLRVGVFVNEGSDLPFRLYGEGMIDVIQLHGDEAVSEVSRFRAAGIPVIKALGIATKEDLKRADSYEVDAFLLDTHAPMLYGGTGKVFDWDLAVEFKGKVPEVPLILAGGIVPENAREAIACVRPAALDVASGAEISPGKKDFEKVRALQECCAS